jgi:hypothetical protein
MVGMENIPSTTVLLADHVPSAPPAEAGKRRGVAGMVFVFKVDGTRAEERRASVVRVKRCSAAGLLPESKPTTARSQIRTSSRRAMIVLNRLQCRESGHSSCDADIGLKLRHTKAPLSPTRHLTFRRSPTKLGVVGSRTESGMFKVLPALAGVLLSCPWALPDTAPRRTSPSTNPRRRAPL